MEHAADLTGIAIVAVAATLCGILLVRLRQPAIVGYIVAGVILGPSGLELVQNREAVAFLAELGVILLLYFIGMELSLRSFRHIWRVAVVTTVAQIALSLGVTFSVAHFFHWPTSHAVLFGFCLALSSTAVAVKVLDDIGALRQKAGRIAVGILIAQDLAVAPMLIFVTSFAGDGFSYFVFIEVAASIGLLLGVILFMTRRQRINLPFHGILESRREISTMGSIALCFGAATLAGLLGMSPAFGAFLAGLIVGNSAQRQALHENAEPVQAVLLMVFFLSVGLLIDIGFLFDNLGIVLIILAFVTIFKTVLNITVLRLQGVDFQNAFLASVVIGQLGEFSFVLAGAASSAEVINSDVSRLIISVAVLSLMTSPILVDLARRLASRNLRDDMSISRIFGLLYRKEWRLTQATSLWLWVLSRDGFRKTAHFTRNWSLSLQGRREALKLARDASERAKARANEGLTSDQPKTTDEKPVQTDALMDESPSGGGSMKQPPRFKGLRPDKKKTDT